MRAVLSSLGSTGDVQPLLALGVELRRGGHDVVAALSPNFESRVRHLGMEFASVGPALESTVIQRLICAQIDRGSYRQAEQVRDYLELVLPVLPDMFRNLLRTCGNADVLIGPPFQLACRMVHEATAIPYVSVHFSPLGMLGAEEVRTVSSALINKVRVKEGFLPLHDPLGKDGASDQLALFAVSRHLLLKPREWPGHYRIVGFFFLEEREWRPDPVLAAFCSGNNPFVVVGFGSVMHSNPETVADLIMQAIDHAKCRAVVQRGWSGLSFSTTPPNVCCVDFVPHSWIFARAALVVHHGGAGTSAAAFRAGVPTVVVPHTLDQPIWAELARSKGCSRSVIPFPQLSVHRLASAIKLSVNNPSLISAAKEFARLVQAEEGVREARRLIEEVLASRSQA